MHVVHIDLIATKLFEWFMKLNQKPAVNVMWQRVANPVIALYNVSWELIDMKYISLNYVFNMANIDKVKLQWL